MSFLNTHTPQITNQSSQYPTLLNLVNKSDVESQLNLSQQFKNDLLEAKKLWKYDENKKTLYVVLDLENAQKNFKKFANDVYQTLESHKVKEFDVQFPENLSQAVFERFINELLVQNYQYEQKMVPQQGETPKGFTPIRNINVLNSNLSCDQLGFAVESARAKLLCKQLSNLRANLATPEYFLRVAQECAQKENVELIYFKGEDLVKNNLNLVHAVGKGSKNEPVMVNLTYRGDQQNENNYTALIGKGVIFDSGGLNIKATGSMEQMYLDKCGACAVLSTFNSVVELKLKINLTVTMSFVENAIGSNSYRPSDIITSHKGLTVDIGNTDAEGRLVLADAMSWTQQKYKPHTMIELSTLTGACMIALGLQTAGLFTNSEELSAQLLQVSSQTSECLWRLPINDEHRDTMKHQVADLSNMGKTTYGGACKAAAFLENFVEKDVKWAHIDIAGPSIDGTGLATGFGTQLLMTFLRNQTNN